MPTTVLVGLILVSAALGVAMAADHKACGLVAWLVPRLRPHVLWLTIAASVVLSIVTASIAQSAIG